MCRRFDVALHAWVLMTNHVHLLMTPSTRTGISRALQGLGRIYVCRVNQRIGRTGTLWEGRHRDSLIETDRYLLACMRYIEENPVRAGIVEAPGEYAWSSHRENASGVPSGLVDPHDVYRGLGSSAERRREAYLGLFEREDPDTVAAFRVGLERRYPVGSDTFIDRLRKLGVSLGEPTAGRPAALAEA